MIQGKTDEEDVKIAASIEIQRVWRGHFTRLNDGPYQVHL